MIINDRKIEIKRKNVKHINLKIYPDLSIKASIPLEMNLNTVRKMILTKDNWINAQLKKYENQLRITKREYISGEDHYLNGKRYILNIIDSKTPRVCVRDKKNIDMYVKKTSSFENKEKLMNSFYKNYLSEKIEKYLFQIETLMNVKCNEYSIRKMKNKWGSCNSDKKTIIFNSDLAKKNDAEIKFVITHELAHLIEKKHNNHFREIMNYYCPKWEDYNVSINELLNSNGID